MGINESTVSAANNRLFDGKKRMGDVHEAISEPDEETFQFVLAPSTELQKCQRAIELFAKALLDLSGVNYPKSHEISVYEEYAQDCIDALESELEEEDGSTAYRTFVIASIWGSAYPATEYGVAGKSPDNAFSTSDAQMAYEHASDIRSRVEETIEKAEEIHVDND